MDPSMILRSVLEGQEISAIEALLLQEDRSLLPEVFRVADHVNRRLHHDVVTYVNAYHVTYTNVCKSGCRTCSFHRKKNAADAYARPIEELLDEVAAVPDITEVRFEGGLNSELPLEYLRDLLRATRRRFPTLQIAAFSPVEVHYFARKLRLPYAEILQRWKDDGLDFMPGTGAEILNDKLRKKICPDKLRTGDWIEIVRTAHQLGIPTSASILFGHIENEVHVVEHLDIVRNLQKETGGFLEFAPLPFVPANTTLCRQGLCTERADIDDIFRLFALSRIFFSHAIPNLQVSWRHLGLDTALRSLSLGVNDLGATYHDAHLVHAPDLESRSVAPATLVRLLRKTHCVPRQRDSFYKEIAPVTRRRPALANR